MYVCMYVKVVKLSWKNSLVSEHDWGNFQINSVAVKGSITQLSPRCFDVM